MVKDVVVLNVVWMVVVGLVARVIELISVDWVVGTTVIVVSSNDVRVLVIRSDAVDEGINVVGAMRNNAE